MSSTPYKSHLDYYKLVREFTKQLRGELPQRELSQKLGFTFNQIGKWESGVTQLKWTDFLSILSVLGVPYEEKIRYFFGNYTQNLDPADVVPFLENFLALKATQNEVVLKLLKKWKSHAVSPDLAEIFLMLDQRPAMLIGFLTHFVNCAKIEMIEEDYKLLLRQQNILFEDPVVGYVQEALKVKDYIDLPEHDDEVLARHASCSVNKLKEILKLQTEIKTIYFDGKKYYPSEMDFSFSTLRTPLMRRFNKYTLELIANKYRLEDEEFLPGPVYNVSMSSHRVAALSQDAAQKIDKLINKFHNEVGEIVRQDQGEKHNVQIMSVASVASTIVVKPKNTLT